MGISFKAQKLILKSFLHLTSYHARVKQDIIKSKKESKMTESIDLYLANYIPIVIFFVFAIGLSVFLLVLSYLRTQQNPNPEKISPYECGFNAFDDTRHRFDIRFYLVAILFIIFDIEIAFLFPWAISLGKIGLFGFWSMILFLSPLTVGFIYEWKKGALEWE